jgi:hypothetical protein
MLKGFNAVGFPRDVTLTCQTKDQGMKNGQAPHSAGIPKRGGTPYILTPWIHKLNIKTTPILTEVKRYINDDLINSYKTRPGVNDRNSRNKTYD